MIANQQQKINIPEFYHTEKVTCNRLSWSKPGTVSMSRGGQMSGIITNKFICILQTKHIHRTILFCWAVWFWCVIYVCCKVLYMLGWIWYQTQLWYLEIQYRDSEPWCSDEQSCFTHSDTASGMKSGRRLRRDRISDIS